MTNVTPTLIFHLTPMSSSVHSMSPLAQPNFESSGFVKQSKGDGNTEEEVLKSSSSNDVACSVNIFLEDSGNVVSKSQPLVTGDDTSNSQNKAAKETLMPYSSDDNTILVNNQNFLKDYHEEPIETNGMILKSGNLATAAAENIALITFSNICWLCSSFNPLIPSHLPGIGNHTNPFGCITQNCASCSDKPSRSQSSSCTAHVVLVETVLPLIKIMCAAHDAVSGQVSGQSHRKGQ